MTMMTDGKTYTGRLNASNPEIQDLRWGYFRREIVNTDFTDLEVRVMARIHSQTAIRVLMRMRDRARLTGNPNYNRIKRQLYGAMYGMRLRALHAMAKEAKNNG